ncbi:MAG: hypothetical protein ACR5K7_03470 [Symbiopectobacterium sp.]
MIVEEVEMRHRKDFIKEMLRKNNHQLPSFSPILGTELGITFHPM